MKEGRKEESKKKLNHAKIVDSSRKALKSPALQRPREDEFLFGVSVPSLRMSNSLVLSMSLQEEGLADVGRSGIGEGRQGRLAASRSFGPTPAEIEAREAMENLRGLLDHVQRLVPQDSLEEDDDDDNVHRKSDPHFAKDAEEYVIYVVLIR